MADRIGAAKIYPAEELYKAWRNCILFDEHTWGAYCSVSNPESEFTKAQWKIKAQFAVDADRKSAALFDRCAGHGRLVRPKGRRWWSSTR